MSFNNRIEGARTPHFGGSGSVRESLSSAEKARLRNVFRTCRALSTKREADRRANRSVSRVAYPAGGRSVDVLALRLALEDFAILDTRQAFIAQLRYFGVLTEEEIARRMDRSSNTIRRELASAKVWLRQWMRQV